MNSRLSDIIAEATHETLTKDLVLVYCVVMCQKMHDSSLVIYQEMWYHVARWRGKY
jgi:hypothetical protein